MIGNILVKTKNPPCRECGGMAGYHSKDCRHSAVERPEGFIEKWAKANGYLGIAARYAMALESAVKDRNAEIQTLKRRESRTAKDRMQRSNPNVLKSVE